MQAAKARAAERAETLKDLVTRAVTHELRIPVRPIPAGRVSLPLISSAAKPSISVTNADIDAALEAEHAERYAGR